MKIKPDYSKSQVCYYCGKHISDNSCSLEETWYAIAKTHSFPLSVEYISVIIEIPRCEHCKKIHDKADSFSPFILLLSILFFMWFFLFYIDWLADTWSTILGVFLSIIFGLFSGYLISAFVSMLRTPNSIKESGNTRSYGPIKKLLDCGFQSNRPDAAASVGKQPLDRLLFTRTLNSIKTEDNCFILN